jgi:hypothetical protein
VLCFSRLTEAPLHQLREQQIECAFDDRSKIPARVCVSHQVTRELQLFLQGQVGGKLHAIAPQREWLETTCLPAPP